MSEFDWCDAAIRKTVHLQDYDVSGVVGDVPDGYLLRLARLGLAVKDAVKGVDADRLRVAETVQEQADRDQFLWSFFSHLHGVAKP